MTRLGTLLDLLLTAAEAAPDQTIVQVAGDGSEQLLTFQGLLDESLRIAGGLRAAGLEPGTPVIVLPGSSTDFLPGFWGAVAAGLLPVPLAPTPDKILAISAHLDRPPVLVNAELDRLAGQFATAGPALTTGTTPLGRRLLLEELRQSDPIAHPHRPAPEDIAFLQFSSGSTGAPKGVELSHRNVLANLDQARVAGAVTRSDVIASWLPYFHDMGLIGAHLTPLSLGIKQVTLDPADFGRRPALWYETAARHRATLLPMASFALALTLKRVSAVEVAVLDLSSVRLVTVGAEPIAVPLWHRFLRHMRPAGLEPSSLAPVYGLAEATLAVAFPPLGEVAQPLALDRDALSHGFAIDAQQVPAGTAAAPAKFLDLGYAVPGGRLRVVGDNGEVLADSLVGQVEYCGPNVARGYHGRPEDTNNTFVDGWLRTGDLGFLRSGRLCVTGRAKDVLFIHGQKFHAHDLEQVVAGTPEAPPGRVAVVGTTDPASGVERVAVFVTSRERPTPALAPALAAVHARVCEALAYDNVQVLPIPPGDFPRTTSGKIQRSILRDRLAAGAFTTLEGEVAALRFPTETPAATAPPPTRSDAEKLIAQIWAEVLNVPASSIARDDRFLAIGGSSLSAMHVLHKLEASFGRPLQPSVLRDCATVAALAEELTGRPDGSPSRPEARPRRPRDPAVIIGMACRFPDADTPEEFWRNLAEGRDSVREVPPCRWQPAAGAKARWGGFLTDVAGFDAGFFGVEAAEAAVMDPHARIFLEVAHEALERAGYAGDRRRTRRIGVFVAVGESGYPELLHQALAGGFDLPPAALVGNLRNLIAARVAHHLDLSGPVMAVDTACSSALVALHLARHSLEAGECDAAVVGGVNLNITATGYRLLEAAQALSPTGRSRAFSSDADGFVPGEGAAAVVLEPLSEAETARDHVLAVVRGTTVNNDGRSLSLMAPNPVLQEAVIAEAYQEAGIDPATISYIEAHGTGTAIGDPIEARSLIRTFRAAPAARGRWLGSVKTNIGHLLNAAGMPSLLKVVLSLGHRALPPSLHYAAPATSFDLSAGGFEVVTELLDWTSDGPLRAGINSFGFGGTNAHVILEEPPRRPPTLLASASSGPQLLTISAATEPALRVAARDLAAHARTHPEINEADLCTAASTARDHRRHRLALVADGDLAERLAYAGSSAATGSIARRRPRIALLFAGTGTQVRRLGRSLQSQPVYRQVMEELSETTADVAGRTLVAWSLDDVPDQELAQAAVAQPLLVAFGIALTAQLQSWGIAADAVVGHGVGELAAIAVAGGLSPAEAVRFAAQRGRLMQQQCAPGATAEVAGPVALDELRQTAGGLSPLPWRSPLLSTVTVGWNPTLDPAYFIDHARKPVQFAPSVQRLLAEGFDTFVTVGPGGALRSRTNSIVRAQAGTFDIAVLSTLDGGGNGAAALLGTVGRLWQRGVTISRPADGARRPHPPAPTYPFQRTRHWLPGLDTARSTGRSVSSLLHRFSWQEVALPAGEVLTSIGVVGSHPTLLPALSDQLARRGVRVHFGPLAEPDELPRVSAMVMFAGSSAEFDSLESIDAVTRSAAGAVPRLARFLAQRPTPLIVLTEDVAVTGAATERARPGQAILAGLALALPEENPRQPVRIVDLSTLDDEHECLSALIRELDAPPRVGPAESVAWRTGRRLARTPQLAAPGIAAGPSLPPDGCYLITGGAGGIGAAVARTLAARGAPRLYLVGRSAQGADMLVEELKSRGARTRYVCADLAVPADVDALVAALPQLDGVLHAAGVLIPGPLISASVADIDAVCAAKVRGTYLLARALDRTGNRPRAFVSFSSIVSALPGYAGGLGAYAAGNSFIDAFAAAEVHAGRPMQVLNFAAWTDTGMATSAAFRTHATTHGVPQIHRRQAADAVLDAMTVDAVQLLVLDAETLPDRTAASDDQQSTDAKGAKSIDTESSGAEPGGAVASPTPPLAPSGPSAPPSVRDVVATLIAAELGQRPDELDDEASLLAMGLDSLAAVDLVRKLEQQLGRDLPTTLLFEHPSIAQLSAHLASGSASAASPTRSARQETQPFALTPVQLGFHTSGRLHPDVAAYAYLRQTVAGGLDPQLLARSLVFLEQRHPMLRVRIRTIDGQPRQLIEPQADRDWPAWFVTRPLTGSRPAAEDEFCNRVFDLAREGPLRAALLEEGPRRGSLLLLLHHAAADGASLNVLGAELWQVYTALAQGDSPSLAPLPSTFQDYAELLRQRRATSDLAGDLRYWSARLRQREPSADRWRGSGMDSRALPSNQEDGAPAPPLTAQQFDVDPGLTHDLRARAAELDVSLFHLVLTAYVSSLAGWTSDPHVTVNVARSGREARLAGIGQLVGPLADTLPVSVVVNAHEPAALPQAVRAAWLESEQHGTATTLDLARILPAVGAGPRTAGVASFSFARFPIQLPTDCPVRIEETAARTGSAATRLGLLCWEFEGALRFSWNYPAQLFTRATIERFTGDLLAALATLAEPERPTGPETSIAQRIWAQCRRTPHAVAVEDDIDSLTYGELDRAARRLALRLRTDGIRPGDRVALLTQPGPNTVAGLLGVLYAGATWVPLDPAHPPARLRDLVERAHPTAVVCHEPTHEAAAQLGIRHIVLTEPLNTAPDRNEPDSNEPDRPVADPAPDDIAYIIFTSGTTGRPKGVPIEHRSMAGYLDWAIQTFGYHAGDRMLATASICFDASVRQLLAPLLVGATIVTASRDAVRDPKRLLDLVEQRRVTIWSSVPTLWEQLLASAKQQIASGRAAPDVSTLRWVHVGGEALSPASVRRWFDLFGSEQRIVNLYGPTEATINATYYVIDCRPDDSVTRIPIGRPAAQTMVDVVDPEGVSCPDGNPGELLLAGPGLSPGYLDEPDLTAAAFVERGGRRYYRSGDRVVRRSDGTLEFLCRIDQQVKIRGHRVEPGEVEAALRDHPAVERAAVVARTVGSGGHQALVGYVQPWVDGPAVTTDQLRAHLVAQVPDYLVPAQLVVVDQLPLTTAGKLDVARLGDLTPTRRRPEVASRTPPRGPTEEIIAAVWQELLGVDQVSREDDFFALGGDSIAVLEVFARLEPQLERLPAPTVIYRHRTLAGLAAAICATDTQPLTTQGRRTAGKQFPLSPAQRGFLLAEALSPTTPTSWLSCFRLTGPLDPTSFQQAVNRLVERHPMLRTVIMAHQRPPVQEELTGPVSLEIHCDVIPADDLPQCLAAERRHRFDISSWPLIRLQLLRVGSQEHALIVHAHHLLGDGYSVVILAQDLMRFYDEVAAGAADTLPPLRSTFRDYVELLPAEAHVPHRQPTDSDHDQADRPPTLRRADTTDCAPVKASFTLDRRTTAALRQLAAIAQVTPYAPLLTACYRSLMRLIGQPDLVIGVAVTGRDHALPDLNRIVGPLATVIPVRFRDLAAHFSAQLRQVAEAVSQARASGATLQHRLRDPSGSGHVMSFGAQFLFSYLDFEALGPIAGERLQLTWYDGGTDLEPPPVGTDLLLTGRPIEGCLQVTVRASAGVMSAAELDDFAATLRGELTEAAESDGAVGRTGSAVVTPDPSTIGRTSTNLLDAALIGYLPAPRDLMAMAGIAPTEALRESIRCELFPDGQPRLLAELTTPLGRSGFLCLPHFADELAPAAGAPLGADVARAVDMAAGLGARAVSLAGMIPAYTGYGYQVVQALGPDAPRLTTGHAATAGSVVKTMMLALAEAQTPVEQRTLTVLGLGSIGSSSLRLLLALDIGVPKRLLLCDVASRAKHLRELTEELRAQGYPAEFVVCEPDGSMPAAAYASDLIIAAISADRNALEINRLRPGTIVVDDSFPHCFDVPAAARRMADQRDVVVVGGGQLSAGPSHLRPVDHPLAQTYAKHLIGLRIPNTIPSCQIEALMQVNRPDLPPVRGLLDATVTLTYWRAFADLEIRAAPLHLAQQLVTVNPLPRPR